MTRRVYLRAEAEEEIGQAAEWYAERGLELASAFLDEVSVTIAVLQSTPEHYSVVEASIRKAVLRRFPYVILFRATDEEVVVISCFRTRRDPREWRERV